MSKKFVNINVLPVTKGLLEVLKKSFNAHSQDEVINTLINIYQKNIKDLSCADSSGISK